MRMSRPIVRTMIVALSGGAIIALGSAPVVAAPERPSFPLGTQTEREPEKQLQSEKKPEPAEKAEKLSGGVATKIIDLGQGLATKIVDMGAGVAKCGLSIAAPSVKCD